MKQPVSPANQPVEFENLETACAFRIFGATCLLERPERKRPKLKVIRSGNEVRFEGSSEMRHGVLDLTVASGRCFSVHIFHSEKARLQFLDSCQVEGRFEPSITPNTEEAPEELAQRMHNLLKRGSRYSKIRRWMKNYAPRWRNRSPKIWREKKLALRPA